MNTNAPVFVRIDEYKDVVELMGLVKDKLEEARVTLGKINELKNEEDSELDMWEATLSEVEKKVGHVDKFLFQPQNL